MREGRERSNGLLCRTFLTSLGISKKGAETPEVTRKGQWVEKKNCALTEKEVAMAQKGKIEDRVETKFLSLEAEKGFEKKGPTGLR